MQTVRLSGKANRDRFSIPKWLCVVTILTVLLILFGSGERLSSRALIVNSDDAGMCSSVNKGTIVALESGLLKSTSIMTCCPAFEDFAAYARSHPQYDYGVHLTLTCDLRAAGWGPVMPKSEVPSLVDKNGLFHSYNGAVADMADIHEAEAELRAQITKAKNAGIRITHFDNHMFVLNSRPDLLELYVKLGIEFGLPIRFSRELPEQYLNDQTAIKRHAKLIEQLGKAGLPVLDRIESDNYSISAAEKRTYFLNQLQALRPGVTEIVVHCAAHDDSGIEPPDADARYADARCFSSQEFLDEIRNLRAIRLTWDGLQNHKDFRMPR